MIWIILFPLVSFFINPLSSADPTQRWLVDVGISGTECVDTWRKERNFNKGAYLMKALPVEGWLVMEIPGSSLASLQKLPCVRQILEDKKIDWRDTQPNDPAYINQQDMTLIGMPKAWDIARGGVTAQGDTIVVALIDDGYQMDHEDLIDNIWHNTGELPNDGLDNDGNGYTDDYLGLNVSLSNDQHPVKSHGTSVAGIVGAKGNNSIGVSGVNWNVKLMLISGTDFESELIEGFQYVLDLRKKYRQTNGAEGAFVVVTNMSGGVNGALAADHPLWCGMYDEMGEEGILSVCAAPNNPISVDVEGDMPTTCPSPFMIAVTNVDLTDELVGNAGFGITSIDLGAPGHGTITIASGNQYKEFNGTSAAAPHVAGAVALIYSTPCVSFLYDVKSNPQGTAARVRDIIFSTANPNNSMDEITVTGKRLQVDGALKATVTDCEEVTSSGVNIFSIRPNPARLEDAQIFFEVEGDTTNAFFELYSVSGARVLHMPISEQEYSQGFIRINTEPLPAGIYMLTLRNQKEKVTQKLFVY